MCRRFDSALVTNTRLTPFYDLMCTRIYPGLSKHFAFDIGGTALPGEMEAKHIVAMVEQLDVRPGFALSIGQEVAQKLPTAIAEAVSNSRPILKPGGEATMASKVTDPSPSSLATAFSWSPARTTWTVRGYFGIDQRGPGRKLSLELTRGAGAKS